MRLRLLSVFLFCFLAFAYADDPALAQKKPDEHTHADDRKKMEETLEKLRATLAERGVDPDSAEGLFIQGESLLSSQTNCEDCRKPILEVKKKGLDFHMTAIQKYAYPPSMAAVGIIMLKEWFVFRDENESKKAALDYLERAAEEKVAWAQYYYGYCLLKGYWAKRNTNQAIIWLNRFIHERAHHPLPDPVPGYSFFDYCESPPDNACSDVALYYGDGQNQSPDPVLALTYYLGHVESENARCMLVSAYVPGCGLAYRHILAGGIKAEIEGKKQAGALEASKRFNESVVTGSPEKAVSLNLAELQKNPEKESAVRAFSHKAPGFVSTGVAFYKASLNPNATRIAERKALLAAAQSAKAGLRRELTAYSTHDIQNLESEFELWREKSTITFDFFTSPEKLKSGDSFLTWLYEKSQPYRRWFSAFKNEEAWVLREKYPANSSFFSKTIKKDDSSGRIRVFVSLRFTPFTQGAGDRQVMPSWREMDMALSESLEAGMLPEEGRLRFFVWCNGKIKLCDAAFASELIRKNRDGQTMKAEKRRASNESLRRAERNLNPETSILHLQTKRWIDPSGEWVHTVVFSIPDLALSEAELHACLKEGR